MHTALALGLALFVPLAACAAEQGRIHASPADDGAAAQGSDTERSDAAPARDAVPVVRYDEPFSLAFHHRVRVERSDIRLRFTAVLEDSRCPTGVQCVQAGRARVRLEVSRGRRPPVAIELGTGSEASLASAGGVTWELQRVDPYPVAGRRHHASAYVLTLVAHPLRSR